MAAFLFSGTLESSSTVHLGILNSRITNRNQKNKSLGCSELMCSRELKQAHSTQPRLFYLTAWERRGLFGLHTLTTQECCCLFAQAAFLCNPGSSARRDTTYSELGPRSSGLNQENASQTRLSLGSPLLASSKNSK